MRPLERRSTIPPVTSPWARFPHIETIAERQRVTKKAERVLSLHEAWEEAGKPVGKLTHETLKRNCKDLLKMLDKPSSPVMLVETGKAYARLVITINNMR